MIAAPAGQWPRNTTSSNMHQLAFYPHNSSGTAYEIGFSIINVSANNFELKTYGMGSVGDKVQPSGYRSGDDRSKQLMDTLSYSKLALIANAGPDINVNQGDTVSFDGSDSQALSGSIISYQWSNGLTGVSASKVYSELGSFPVTLTVKDNQGNRATDSVVVTVLDQSANYKKDFESVDFRGTANSWGKTAMNLIGDNTWQLIVNVTDSQPSFKFYANGKWYGDDQADGETHSNERANIALSQGPGLYQITLTDHTRQYRVTKL